MANAFTLPNTIANGDPLDATPVQENMQYNNDKMWKGTAFPTGGDLKGAGQHCYRTDLLKEYVYDGSAWVESASGGTGVAYGTAYPDATITTNVYVRSAGGGKIEMWVNYIGVGWKRLGTVA